MNSNPEYQFWIFILLFSYITSIFAVEGVELSKEARALGFPIEHKHKLACLRQELIDSFVEARYVQFIKHAAVHLQQLTSARRVQKEKEITAKVNRNGLKYIMSINEDNGITY